MEELLEKRFEIMRDTYEAGAEMFPTMVFIDFKWIFQGTEDKVKDVSMGIPIPCSNHEDRDFAMAALGLASAILTTLKVSSGPESVMVASEAFVSIKSNKEIEKAIKSKKKILRPSEDPDRIEVAIVQGEDKKNKTIGAVQEIVSVVKEKDGKMYLGKNIIETDRIKKLKLNKMKKLDSTLTRIFWHEFNEGTKRLAKDAKKGGTSHLDFMEEAERDPKGITHMIIQQALDSIVEFQNGK